MNWIKDNWFKAAIVIVSLILVGGYVSHLERVDDLAEQYELQDRINKQDSEKREYIASRKQDCLKIYQTEGDKWNNVHGWSYDDFADICEITYDAPNKKSKEECEQHYKDSIKKFLEEDELASRVAFTAYTQCLDGVFVNSF